MHGLEPVATWEVKGDQLFIDGGTVLEKAVYVWLAEDGEVMRVGASKRPLNARLREYVRDVSNALQGDYRRTSEASAQLWRRKARGKIIAREGTVVETPVGPVNVYLAEELALIEKYDPPSNNRTG